MRKTAQEMGRNSNENMNLHRLKFRASAKYYIPDSCFPKVFFSFLEKKKDVDSEEPMISFIRLEIVIHVEI